MTTVFEPCSPDGWEMVWPLDSDDYFTFRDGLGRPLGGSWVPIRMQLVREDERGQPWSTADMPFMGSSLLILKPRARSVLTDLCLEAGELLPLACEDAELVAWNVTLTVDALDEGASDIVRFRDGRVMYVRRPVFHPERVRGLAAFRLPQWRGSIFLGERFVRVARGAGLTGTTFQEVWSA